MNDEPALTPNIDPALGQADAELKCAVCHDAYDKMGLWGGGNTNQEPHDATYMFANDATARHPHTSADSFESCIDDQRHEYMQPIALLHVRQPRTKLSSIYQLLVAIPLFIERTNDRLAAKYQHCVRPCPSYKGRLKSNLSKSQLNFHSASRPPHNQVTKERQIDTFRD